jgi:hypothetical protein
MEEERAGVGDLSDPTYPVFGCENRSAQLLPIQSWNLILMLPPLLTPGTPWQNAQLLT